MPGSGLPYSLGYSMLGYLEGVCRYPSIALCYNQECHIRDIQGSRTPIPGVRVPAWSMYRKVFRLVRVATLVFEVLGQ